MVRIRCILERFDKDNITLPVSFAGVEQMASRFADRNIKQM